MKKQLSCRVKGIIYIIVSAFFFALMGVFVASSGDLPSVQKSFFRNSISVIVAAFLVIKKGEKVTLNKKGLGYLVLRSIFGTAGILCNFYAIDNLPLADASMLNKMAPFFTIIFSYLFLKEKISLKQLLIIAIAFAGSMFVVKPTFANTSLIPSFIGLMGGVCAGAAYTMVRKLGENKISGPFVVLFFSTFSCLTTLPVMILKYEPMTTNQIITLIMAGVCASFGQFSITQAYFNAPAREISVYDYSQIVFSAMLGIIVFSQRPDVFSFIGYTIIISMAVIMFFYNKNNS
ncbi:Uncharacterized membrane protein [Hathewaya proteolytica DSM 3090]|uniref:Uncharacterized membrane protein n=1 Tax=Hathewaya proteolytica DSM 3090 TaxID=1121331 RepID=A0A1M6PUC1_9CLOT|nr:DMT family transporter [Hathewaya proteolytica]SHK11507.1 Uncharacterized membrane protein [Hathewaya proteolytica DSM 3090]